MLREGHGALTSGLRRREAGDAGRGENMTAPPEPQGLHGVPGRQLGNPTAKVRSARGLPAPAVREAGAGSPLHPRGPL